jgi:hypothetical protein
MNYLEAARGLWVNGVPVFVFTFGGALVMGVIAWLSSKVPEGTRRSDGVQAEAIRHRHDGVTLPTFDPACRTCRIVAAKRQLADRTKKVR